MFAWRNIWQPLHWIFALNDTLKGFLDGEIIIVSLLLIAQLEAEDMPAIIYLMLL